MKSYAEWLKIREMAGTGAIVSKKDCNNPNFQIWGDLCNSKKKKVKESTNDDDTQTHVTNKVAHELGRKLPARKLSRFIGKPHPGKKASTSELIDWYHFHTSRRNIPVSMSMNQLEDPDEMERIADQFHKSKKKES